MTTNLKIALIIIMLLFLLYVFKCIRSDKLLMRHALIWVIADIVAILCVIFVEPLFKVTNFLGIEKVSNMMFFIGFVVVLIICLNFSNQLSIQNKKLINAIQEIGILKNKLESEKDNDK